MEGRSPAFKRTVRREGASRADAHCTPSSLALDLASELLSALCKLGTKYTVTQRNYWVDSLVMIPVKS